MIGLIQRVSEARVSVDGQVVGRIARGLLVLIGVDMQVSLVNDGPVTFWLQAGAGK